MSDDLVTLFLFLHRETESAILFSDTGDDKDAAWLPRSQITVEECKGAWEVTAPEWLLKDKGFI